MALIVERRRLPVHKAVLALRSEVFSGLIRAEEEARAARGDSTAVELVLSDLSFDSAIALIEFVYTDNLAQPLGPLSPGLSHLVLAAEKYGVPKLAALCRWVG